MGIISVVKNIKQVHEEDIVLTRIGKFYYSYGKDAYILSYIFQYKLIQIEEGHTYSCAFPQGSFPKVTAWLENRKINYIVVDKRNNYDTEEKMDNGNLNTYEIYIEKAKTYISMKKRIENISNYLLEHIEEPDTKEKMKQMEMIINETRKI